LKEIFRYGICNLHCQAIWCDQCRKVLFSLRTGLGFFVGLIFAAGLGGMGSVLGSHALGIGAGLFGLVIMVIAGGVAGFAGGAIVAVLYNIILGAMGGIEMDLEVKG